MDRGPIYTIGHSDHTLAQFVTLLRQHGITLVADVRSQPYSRWASQFNREVVSVALVEKGIAYEYLGDVLGGRPTDLSLYNGREGRPDYTRMRQTPQFQAGLGRLLASAQNQCVAVMCSEGDFRGCHRHLLIAQSLLARGAWVLHIQPDGSTVEAMPEPRQLSLFG